MSFGFADHLRQTHNATRIATVEEIDWEKREFRAKSGDILTNWLPFPAFITHNDGGCYKSRGENVINGKNREAAGKYGKRN